MNEPRRIGRRDDPREPPRQVEPVAKALVARDRDACEDVVVAGEDLRRRVEDDVATLVERPEAKRCGHRRVAHDGRRVGDGRREVGHRQERVRRRLDEDQVGLVGRRARLVELHDVKLPRREVVEEHAVAVVRPLGDGDRPTRAEQREHDRRHRAHPRGIEQRMAAVERTERLLAGHAGRMVGPCVREAPRLAALVRPCRRPVERVAHAPTLSPPVVPETGLRA